MRLAGKARFCGSGMGLFRATDHVIRGFPRRSGVVVLTGLLCWPIQPVRRVITGLAAGLMTGLLLAGCAGRTEPEIRYVRVEVPVQVSCRAPKVSVPPWAAAGLRRSDSLEVKVRALLAERRQRIGYERQLTAAVSVCR